MRCETLDTMSLGPGHIAFAYHVGAQPAWKHNSTRPHPVPESVIRRLAARLDVPDLTEAHGVEWIIPSQAD